MNIDFLAITSLLVASRYLIAFIALCLVTILGYRTFTKAKKDIDENGKIEPKFIVKTALLFSAIFFAIVFLFSGVTSPRGVIDIPYKTNPIQENIEIYTPPLRVEKLDGFVPLKN